MYCTCRFRRMYIATHVHAARDACRDACTRETHVRARRMYARRETHVRAARDACT